MCSLNEEPQPVSLLNETDVSKPLKSTPVKPKPPKKPRVTVKTAANVEDEDFLKTIKHAEKRDVNIADHILDTGCRVSIHILRLVLLFVFSLFMRAIFV